jgi:demethylmenaquinone methyltransferase/2-methoxy-6-polyprenyl-1,4-benzoquinol methylase
MQPLVEHVSILGARPAAEAEESTAAVHVRELFDSIAPSYDLLNHLLSMGLDRHWWRRTARAFAGTLAHPKARVLDICCGTGDLTAAMHRLRNADETSVCNRCIGAAAAAGEAEPVTGLDFSSEMLSRARAKYAGTNIRWVEADAMRLPFPDSSLDLVTSAFGFRNLTNYPGALAEIYRVLRPGGQIGILECNNPDGLSGALYNLYFKHVLPVIGGAISGDHAAYKYLPASVARFPRPPQMLGLLREAGFEYESWDGYLLRAAGLYRATKL